MVEVAILAMEMNRAFKLSKLSGERIFRIFSIEVDFKRLMRKLN